MGSDKLQTFTADPNHLTLDDGHVFHVVSGYVTRTQGPCSCQGVDPVHQVRSYREAVPQLQISLTDACNLGCTYCSFRERVHADDKPVTMPLETAKRGVAAHHAALSAGEEPYSRIDFGLAGETMLVRNLHERVHRIIEDGLADSPVSVVWAGPMVTNATLSLDPELSDLLGPPQDISVDGPRDVHDRVRFYANNRGGSYDDVRTVLDRVLAKAPDMGVSAVLTAYCTDFTMIFRHLFEDIGARNIYMKPVNSTHDKDYALNEATLPAFMQGYADLVDHLLEQPPEGILARLLALNSEDFLMRYFYRVKDRAAQVYRCGAGKSGTYLDTNGRLYPCAHFIGKSGWHIGTAETGVDETWRRRYLDLAVDTRTECSNCPSRYVCGGGCYYQAVLANGDISKPDAVKCDLIRFLTAQAVRMVATLRTHHPDVLDALPSPYGLAGDRVESGPAEDYRPVGRLVSADVPCPVPLGGRGRSRASLLHPEGLSAALGLDAGRLDVAVRLPADRSQVSGVRVWLQPLGSGAYTLRDLVARGIGDIGMLLRVRPDGAAWRVEDPRRFRRVPYPSAEWRGADDVRWTWADDEVRLDLALPAEDVLPRDSELGLNVFVDYTDGGWTALAIHEPVLLLAAVRNGSGPLEVVGPDAPKDPGAARPAHLNSRLPDELVPLGRWTGLQANTC